MHFGINILQALPDGSGPFALSLSILSDYGESCSLMTSEYVSNVYIYDVTAISYICYIHMYEVYICILYTEYSLFLDPGCLRPWPGTRT